MLSATDIAKWNIYLVCFSSWKSVPVVLWLALQRHQQHQLPIKTTERMNAICKYIASRSNRSVCVCCVLSELSWIMLRLTLSIRNRWASAHSVSLWCIYEMLTVLQCVKYIQSIFMISARVRRTHRARAFITASECIVIVLCREFSAIFSTQTQLHSTIPSSKCGWLARFFVIRIVRCCRHVM